MEQYSILQFGEKQTPGFSSKGSGGRQVNHAKQIRERQYALKMS